MKEIRKVHYVKGVFVCPKCRQSYVQEKWIEELKKKYVVKVNETVLKTIVN